VIISGVTPSLKRWNTHPAQTIYQPEVLVAQYKPVQEEDAIAASHFWRSRWPPRPMPHYTSSATKMAGAEDLRHISQSKTHDRHPCHEPTTMRWRHLGEVQRHKADQHSQAKPVQDPDGDQHCKVWRACRPASPDQREQGRDSESLPASYPVGEPGLCYRPESSPCGEEGIDCAENAAKHMSSDHFDTT
jgi:hypothetical protein